MITVTDTLVDQAGQESFFVQPATDAPAQPRRISAAADRLAIRFTEESQLPTRLKKVLTPEQLEKSNKDSAAEKKLRANTGAWKKVIETMLIKLDADLAWRYIDLKPEVGLEHLITKNGDFLAFTDYFLLRREDENCNSDEIGLLAALLTAFQYEVESKLSHVDK